MPSNKRTKKVYKPAEVPPAFYNKQEKEEDELPTWVVDREKNIIERFSPKIKPKFKVKRITENHEKYYDALRAFDVIAVDGPAGTLKTLLACEAAAEALLTEKIDRIVITRPMIPVGNSSKVGFLPGGLDEKCMVYLSHIIGMFRTLLPGVPLQDALVEDAKLVFFPIDYLRGTSFDRQFVLADEMQNCTSEEIEMLLNRMGNNSRLVINGSRCQIDIPNSGFEDALRRLDWEESEYFTVIEMTENDMVRSKMSKELARRWKKDYFEKNPRPSEPVGVFSEDRFDAEFDDKVPSYFGGR